MRLDESGQRLVADAVSLSLTINVFTDSEGLKATFEQTLPFGVAN